MNEYECMEELLNLYETRYSYEEDGEAKMIAKEIVQLFTEAEYLMDQYHKHFYKPMEKENG